MRRKIVFPRLFLYLFLFASAFFLYHVGKNGEPFSIALSYAVMGAGFSLPAAVAIGVFPSLFSGSLLKIGIYLLQASLLALGYFLERKTHASSPIKTGLFPMLTLSLSLGIFVWSAPFEGYNLPINGILPLNLFTQKVLFAAFLFIISTIFYVALRAFTQKLLKCRLRKDEGVFGVLSLTLVGMGTCRFLSVNAYMGIAFFLLLLYAYVVQNASALLCAFCLSLPPLPHGWGFARTLFPIRRSYLPLHTIR